MKSLEQRGRLRQPALFLVVVALVAPAINVSAAQTPQSPSDLVRQEVGALNAGDVEALLASFSTDASVFTIPMSPDRLVGALSTTIGTQDQRRSFYQTTFRKSARPRTVLGQMLVVGNLVAAELTTRQLDSTPATRSLMLYRVVDGKIRDVWEIANDQAVPSRDGKTASVIRRLIVANNAGDTERFLALFDRDSKYFRGSDDPRGLADKLSPRMSGRDSLRKVITAVFAKGSPGQVEIVGIVTVGDIAVSHDRVTLPSGVVVNQLKIYRVRNDLITHDWTAAEQSP